MKFSKEDVHTLVLNRAVPRTNLSIHPYLTAEAALKFLGSELFELLKTHEFYCKGPYPDTYYAEGVEFIMNKYPPEYEFRSDDGYKFVRVANHPDVPKPQLTAPNV
jgi:hypothetical protein